MKLARREFLLLAKTLKLDQHNLKGWYWSEKLDGTRAFWDGGITRGLPTDTVPWANIMNPKTGERKKKIKPIATGFWSRYGNPIMAPDWFLNKLPCCPLDGELWAGRGKFQLCRSICAGDEPDSRFDQIQFAVFDSPPLPAIFRDGEIKNANFHLQIYAKHIKDWFQRQEQESTIFEDFQSFGDADIQFGHRLDWLEETLPNEGRIFAVPQFQFGDDWKQQIEVELEKILDLGGEGLIIRAPNGLWEPKRLETMLKYKPFEDAEATITGLVAGRRGLTGRMLGKIGALVCETRIRPSRQYIQFEVGSGLTMEQRTLPPKMASWAKEHPGEVIPVWDLHNGDSGWSDDDIVINETFSLRDRITFKYRELSDGGIPKDGRYWRPFVS